MNSAGRTRFPGSTLKSRPARSQLTGLLFAGLAALTSAPGALAAEGGSMTDTATRQLETLGYVERVGIEALDLVIPAKLDTGATTSSINALDQQFFERDGQEWVRFSLEDPLNREHRHTLERQVVREVRIKRHGGRSLRRAVVRMTFCFGHQAVRGQVTLADRSKYKYQLLLGRNHMRDVITVDPGRRYTTEPDCNGIATLQR